MKRRAFILLAFFTIVGTCFGALLAAAHRRNASSGGTAYRYYRFLRVDEAGGAYSLNVFEIELFLATSAPGGAIGTNSGDLTDGLASSFISSGPAFGGTDGDQCFDNDASGTQFYSGAATPAYVGIDLGTAQTARSAKIKNAFAAGSTVKLQGSNDASSWTDLATTSAWVTDVTYDLAW